VISAQSTLITCALPRPLCEILLPEPTSSLDNTAQGCSGQPQPPSSSSTMLDSGFANLRSHPVRTSSYAFSNCKQPWLKAHAGRQANKRACGFGRRCRASTPQYPDSDIASEPAAEESAFARERTSLDSFADTLRGQHPGNSGSRLEAVETETGPVVERAFLVGVAQKGHRDRFAYNIHESLEELGRLAETAGLEVQSSSFPSESIQRQH